MYGLYKYVYNGEVVYIGKSDSSIDKRIDAHAKESKFKPYLDDAVIYYALCKNPAHTTILETYLINKYKPCLNVSMKYEDDLEIEISEPKWKLWKANTVNNHINKNKKLPKPHGQTWIKNQLREISELRARIKALNWLEGMLPNFYGQYDFEIEIPLDIERPDDYLNPFCLSIADRPAWCGWNISCEATYTANAKLLKRKFLHKSDGVEEDFWNKYPVLFKKSRENYQLDINEIIERLRKNGVAMAQAKDKR